MTSIKTNEGGLTLVELLIALIVTGMLMAILISFSVDKLEQSDIAGIKTQLLTNAETGLDTVSNDIRVANDADDNNRYPDPYAPGAPSDELSWASNSTTLVLATAAETSSRSIIFDDAHDYNSAKNNIVYFLNGGTLYRRTLADPVSGNAAITTCPSSDATASCPADSPILSNVSSFSVEYFNGQNQQVDPAVARSIQLSVTLSVKKYNQTMSASYTTRMVFRND